MISYDMIRSNLSIASDMRRHSLCQFFSTAALRVILRFIRCEVQTGLGLFDLLFRE